MNGYDYYQTIEYAACDQDIYQQDIVIHRSEGTSYEETVGGLKVWHVYVEEHCREDYGDVRFTNSTGELAYYLWPDFTSESARFTVRLEGADAAGAVTVHYGNPAASTTSDGDATYFLHDHFTGSALDTSKWTVNGGTWSIIGGYLKQTTTGASGGSIRAPDYPIDLNALSHTVEMNVKWDGGSTVSGSMDLTLAGESLSSDLCMLTLRYETSAKKTEIRRERDVPSSKSLSWDTASWHILRADFHGSAVDGYVDGVKHHANIAHGLTASPGYCIVHTWDAQPIHDYILVRAYSATPPAATAFGPEQRLRRSSGIALGSANMMVI